MHCSSEVVVTERRRQHIAKSKRKREECLWTKLLRSLYS